MEEKRASPLGREVEAVGGGGREWEWEWEEEEEEG